MFSQNADRASGQDTLLSYSGVLHAANVSKSEMYIRARDWLNNNMQSLQIQDKETGELSGRGIEQGSITFRFLGSRIANANFVFTITIWVKEGQLMYCISNINNTSITYNNNTVTEKNDVTSTVGMLYTTDHVDEKVLGLSKTKSNEVYLSAKKSFNNIIKEMVASLTADIQKSSTPNF